MEFKEIILDELKDYNVTVDQYGITISSIESDPVGISIGWVKDSNVLSVRDKVVALKRFDEIEDFLHPILDKYQIGSGGFVQSLNGNTFVGTLQKEYLSDLFFTKKSIETNREESITSFSDKVISIFSYVESDFFSKYCDLNKWKNAYENLKFNELVPMVNQPFPLRNSVMKYLFNSEDKEEYNNRVSKKFLESNDDFKALLGKSLIDIGIEKNKPIT